MLQKPSHVERFEADERKYSVLSIRVKWTPKPAPVKRRPPTACRFYFAEFAVPLAISSSHPPVLAHVANAPHLAAYCRLLPYRFVSPLAAPTAPPGPAFLAPPGGPPVSPRPGRTSTISLHRAVERA